MGLTSLSWLWMNYWLFNCKNKSAKQTLVTTESAHLMWISGQRSPVHQQLSLKTNEMSLKYYKNNKQMKKILIFSVANGTLCQLCSAQQVWRRSPGNVYIVFLSRPHICFELWQQFDRFHVKSFLPLSRKELFINIYRQQSKQEFRNTDVNFTSTWKCLCPSITPMSPLNPCLQQVPVHWT